MFPYLVALSPAILVLTIQTIIYTANKSNSQ